MWRQAFNQQLSLSKLLVAPAAKMKKEISYHELYWPCGRSLKVTGQSLSSFNLTVSLVRLPCEFTLPSRAKLLKSNAQRYCFCGDILNTTVERWKGEAEHKPLECTRHHQCPGKTRRPRRSIQVTEHWLLLVHQQGSAPHIPLFSWQPSWLGFKVVVLVDITQHKNANACGTVIPQQLQDKASLS